ncbi:hypothetical protein [Pseudonocardia sp. ICBG601]|uniref:hypothetical protein n=1 Tax=Pseudonocardia sp. ICBG601 TaxID=2846759 RepID=UPI001CF70C43|nr:hypothetical protein [Pseudonocardia sp. ICBG601]
MTKYQTRSAVVHGAESTEAGIPSAITSSSGGPNTSSARPRTPNRNRPATECSDRAGTP